MRIGIFSQSQYYNYKDDLKYILQYFKDSDIIPVIEKSWAERLDKETSLNTYEKFSLTKSDISSLDMFMTVGGDGTILRAVSHIQDIDVPIVGVNTGRLGFLASIQKEDVPTLIQIIKDDKIKTIHRSLLQVVSPDLEMPFALNEIAINRKDSTSMITIDTHLNGEYLNSYWADGLLISTPTGSTGYSLSCGGPIMIPTTDSFIINPIAPHNLSVRPLIISDLTELTLKVSGRSRSHLISLDARVSPIKNHAEITIKKADFSIKMVQLDTESFFNTLRKKLLWGEDKRNHKYDG